MRFHTASPRDISVFAISPWRDRRQGQLWSLICRESSTWFKILNPVYSQLEAVRRLGRIECRSTKNSRPKKPESVPDSLKGWRQIATFLGQPVSVAQRWAKTGMPVKREGRFVTTSPVELNVAWTAVRGTGTRCHRGSKT